MSINEFKKAKLESAIDQWLEKEDMVGETDFRQEWVNEGIELHKELIRYRLPEEEKIRIYHVLAELYLEFGRSEKIIEGNNKKAFRYLLQAAKISRDKGDPFYHLAFLAESMTMGKEKWESVAFYAKEALERRLDEDKQIKIFCLLGKAYNILGFKDRASECFSRSKKLDVEDKYYRFRENYSRQESRTEVFRRLKGLGYSSEREYLYHLIAKSKKPGFYLLHISRRGTTLYGNGAEVGLSVIHAEILKLLFESELGLTRDEIFHNTIGIGRRARRPETVKTDISRINSLLRNELGVQEKQIIFDRRVRRYRWNPNTERCVVDY